MGEYYLSEDNELVRTVTRAQSIENGRSLIICVIVGKNGEAKNTIAMSEEEFEKKFLRTPAPPIH